MNVPRRVSGPLKVIEFLRNCSVGINKMSEESELKTKKTTLKSKLTKFYKFLEKYDRENLNDEIVLEIESRLEVISPILSELNEVIVKLINLKVTNLEAILAEEEEFEDKYFKSIARARLLCKLFNMAEAEVSTAAGSNASQKNLSFNEPRSTSVKLPPITLPTFNGKYCSWLEFKDIFINLVDENESLSNIQKFYYLRASLDKNVLEVIQSIEVSATNYSVAWQFLVDRFENKALMIHNHIQGIFEHHNLTSESHT